MQTLQLYWCTLPCREWSYAIKIFRQILTTSCANWVFPLWTVSKKLWLTRSLHKFLFHPIHMMPPAELLIVFPVCQGIVGGLVLFNLFVVLYFFFSQMCSRMCVAYIYLCMHTKYIADWNTVHNCKGSVLLVESKP